MIQTIKKSILGAVVFLGTLLLGVVSYGAWQDLIHQQNGDVMNETIWNAMIDKINSLGTKADNIDSRVTTLESGGGGGSSAPDYDSGRFAVNAAPANIKTLTHNFGSLPKNIIAYSSSVSDGSWARQTPLQSPGLSYSSPENNVLSTTDIKLYFFAGDNVIFCNADNPCPAGVVSSQTGYMRVLAWK